MGTMTKDERLQGRAVHAEARAAAAEHRESMLTLKALLDSIPEVQQARVRVTQLEMGLMKAQAADAEFRQQVGDRMGLDLSDPGRVEVDWDTGEVTLSE